MRNAKEAVFSWTPTLSRIESEMVQRGIEEQADRTLLHYLQLFYVCGPETNVSFALIRNIQTRI